MVSHHGKFDFFHKFGNLWNLWNLWKLDGSLFRRLIFFVVALEILLDPL